jgi:DNA-binding transcriptional ArsR family regulator
LSNRNLLEEMKAKRKDTIEQITKRIKDTQTQRRAIMTELKSKGPMTISELVPGTGLSARQVLRQMIALRKLGEITEVGEKDGGYVYGLRRH